MSTKLEVGNETKVELKFWALLYHIKYKNVVQQWCQSAWNTGGGVSDNLKLLTEMFILLGVGTVPVGKIESGVLKPGMTLMFSPAKLTAEVKSIEMHHQGLETALPGHNVGFNIKNVAVKNLRRGDVAGNAQQDPPSDVSSFEAQVG